jgi:predicted nucleic acid-binding protein
VRYLLDTNVLSEVSRRRPDARVLAWLRATPEESLHLSVLSLGELRAGAGELKDAARREKLRVFLESELPARFGERVLAVDARVADRWGRLVAEVKGSAPAVESLLAATALAHGLRVATLNVRDFRFPGLEVVNPWECAG